MNTIRRYETEVSLKTLNTTVHSVVREDGRQHLVLEETIFFPEGGGQPCDLGTIDGVPVISVTEENGLILHHLAESPQVFEPGGTVVAVLDWDRRFSHMQRHLGEHLLSGAFYRLTGGINRGFHMGEDYMTIDLCLEEEAKVSAITPELADAAEEEVNRVIWQDLPVHTRRFATREEALGLPLRKSPAQEEAVRVVWAGDEKNPSDCVACCGTHPETTGQVGLLKLYKIENYKGMFRIYFDAGSKALADYREKHQLLSLLGKKYSAGTQDLLEKIDARETKSNQVRGGFYRLRQSVMKDRIQEMITALRDKADKASVVFRTYDDLPQEDLLSMGRAASPGFGRLLVLQDPGEHTLFLFSDGTPDCGKLVRDHLGIYPAKGGGNGQSARIIFKKAEYVPLFVELLEKHLR